MMKLYYALIPKPHYISKNVSIIKKEKEIAKIKKIKIFISQKIFFNFNKFKHKILFLIIQILIFKNDLEFFEKLLKTEPNENKIIFKNSNIFYENKNDEVLFINKINKSKFFYDSNNLQNVLFQKIKFLIFL